MTHLDALGHFLYQNRGHANCADEHVTPTGLLAHDITNTADGIVGRGVLLDLPRIRNTPYLGPHALVRRSELEEWCERRSMIPAPGDVVFVRTGRPNAPMSEGSEYPAVGGLDLDCAPWFRDWQCTVIVSDAGLDTMTNSPCSTVPTPWHVLTLTRMGVRLVDMADLERLGEACERERRIAFLAILAPLPLGGASASPLNPLAVL
jgi:kynurenine formamidase